MPFLDLPNEILLTIAESISPQMLRDIYSLVLTNRRLAHLLTPHLQCLGATGENRYHTLIWAAASGDEKMVRILVERGARACIALSPLSEDTMDHESDDDVVRLVLEKGVNLTLTPIDGWTTNRAAPVLIQALQMRAHRLITLLLEKGADVRGRDLFGVSPLQHAAESPLLVNALRRLIELGADVHAEDPFGRTPLTSAARYANKHAIRILLESGADMLRRDRYGYTPLSQVLYGEYDLITLINDVYLISLERREAIRTLLQYGDITFKDNYKNTGLHMAAASDDRELAEALLKRGVKVDVREHERKTPLHLAAKFGFTKVVSLLLEHCANMNARDLHGNTPLHWAVKCGNGGVVRLLVEAGADWTARNHTGSTPLHLATHFGRTAIVRLLLWKGINPLTPDPRGCTPIHFAAKWGDVSVVRMLLGKGAIITARDERGRTPLLLAAKYGHVAVVKLLLEKGADIADRDSGDRGVPKWVAEEVLNHPERCIMEMPNISLVNRLRREKDKGILYSFARDFAELEGWHNE